MRLLLCDDTEDTRELLAEALRREGHDVVTAGTATAALEAITARAANGTAIEGAVIDIGLPDLTGYEVARAVRRRLGARSPRLVALTGFGSDEDRAAAFAAGFDAHLLKPVHIAAVLAALRIADPR